MILSLLRTQSTLPLYQFLTEDLVISLKKRERIHTLKAFCIGTAMWEHRFLSLARLRWDWYKAAHHHFTQKWLTLQFHNLHTKMAPITNQHQASLFGKHFRIMLGRTHFPVFFFSQKRMEEAECSQCFCLFDLVEFLCLTLVNVISYEMNKD